MPKFRTPYDAHDKRLRPALVCHDVSKTDQSQAPEADINIMLERFRVTGQINVAAVPPQYGDYSQVMDFQTARQAILYAEDQFLLLPPDFREKLGHDPQNFLSYVSDPDNRAALLKKGWIVETPQRGIGGVAPDAKPAGIAPASAEQQPNPATP